MGRKRRNIFRKGMWITQTEGAKFWLSVMTELKNWGCARYTCCVCRSLKGFSRCNCFSLPSYRHSTLHCSRCS
ncbi:MAG: transposase [Acinetobacter bohemicus]